VSGGASSYAEIASQANKVPYKCVEGPDGRITIEVEHNEEKLALTPEQVTGIMLERMRDTAAGTGPGGTTDTGESVRGADGRPGHSCVGRTPLAAFLGTSVTRAVVTVPQHFTAEQRKALRAAAEHGALRRREAAVAAGGVS